MNKFFTGKGDDGTSGLLGEERLPKSDTRFEALGSLDEASASFGLARSLSKSQETAGLVAALQRDLYSLMAEVASTPPNEERFRSIDSGKVKWLEERIEEIGRRVNMPEEFILPGGSPASAALSLARTVVRRAERRLVELHQSDQYHNQQGLVYLNRLSSLCFLLELDEYKSNGENPMLAKDI